MRAVAPVAVLMGVVVGTGLACGSFDAASTQVEPDASPPTDAAAPACDANVATDPASCGTCGHACGPTESCRAGACTPGCADGIVYVSASGSDTNSGCSRTAPKATIGGAIGYVKTLGLRAHEVHVCRGTYKQASLALDYLVPRDHYGTMRTMPVSIGAYEDDTLCTPP